MRETFDMDLLQKELTFDEGKRLTVYRDSLGNRTIGIGHLMKRTDRFVRISEEKCSELFYEDIQIACKSLDRIIPFWRDIEDPVRRRALVNLSFNLGGKLSKFVNFIRALKHQNWKAAGDSLKDSKWWKQVGLRAPRIYKMIVSADASGYPSH